MLNQLATLHVGVFGRNKILHVQIMAPIAMTITLTFLTIIFMCLILTRILNKFPSIVMEYIKLRIVFLMPQMLFRFSLRHGLL